MQPHRFAKTLLLASLVCAVVGSSSEAADGSLFEVSGTQPRIGLPSIPESLRPVNWLHRDSTDPARNTGVGKPLKGTSWRNRPFHVGWLYGRINGESLISGAIEQKDARLGGYRFGWDFDHYWGTELRFAFTKPDLSDLQGNARLPYATNTYWDLNLLYYPWGDAEWRPFVSAGFGVGTFRFTDASQVVREDPLLTFPVGFGVKYYYRPWMALRTSLMDNIALGTQDLDTMHSLSWSLGVEVHFGGPRRTYYPYHAGGLIW
jgi:hypothetical protein